MSQTHLHQPGTRVRLDGDSRYPDGQPAVVLDNSHYPLYEVRLGTDQHDSKAKRTLVQQSKVFLA